jgi:hypothetical protein
MASSVGPVLFIGDQAGLGRRLSFRKMFGEYALYLDGKVVALICEARALPAPRPKPLRSGLKAVGKKGRRKVRK